MADERILSESQAQAQNIDPFAIARNKAAGQQTIMSTSQPMQGGPFDNSVQMQATGLTPQNPQGQQTSMGTMVKDASQANPTAQQALMSAIKKLGVSAENLPMNQIGKLVLQGRLKEKFGDTYAQHPDAKKVLGNFDSALSIYSDEAMKTQQELLSRTDRTLAALRG